MSPRRGLALVVTVVFLATVTTSAAAATAPVESAKSKPTICVALVVDGRALGSDVSTSCAKVAKGSTGIDVLHAGGHTVGFRNDGLLCTIDGLPKGGCATVDDTHYWAYFHRPPGTTKWIYSSEGASTYQPVDDSTDGWVYDDGKALTPDNVPYAQICKTETSPKPTPAPSDKPTRSAAPTHKTPVSATKAATATPSPSRSSTTAPTRRHRHTPTPSSAPRSASPLATIPSPTPSSTSAALAGAIKPPSNDHGWLDLLIGLVIVAALAVSAAVRFRRSER
jgi:hypothetical protein